MEITEELKKLSLNKDKPSVFTPATDFKSTEKGVCSLFMIKVEPGRKAYRYDVNIVNVTRGKSLAKGADDPCGHRTVQKWCSSGITLPISAEKKFPHNEKAEKEHPLRIELIWPRIRMPCWRLFLSGVSPRVCGYCSVG
uniref:Uncharacterized protein n=1 Tax=Ditylenchus dipsaci TaxID=166011 RepID=A0A915EAB5_9BILA